MSGACHASRCARYCATRRRRSPSSAGSSRRERLTLTRSVEALQAENYEGSYDAVPRHARRWRQGRGSGGGEAFVPLVFAPGEAYPFDWSHELVVVGGVTTTVKAAHMRLCQSRMRFVRCYPRESQEMVFDAHDRAFAFFRGACTRGIYDNMKTAVNAVFAGKERRFNRRSTIVTSQLPLEKWHDHLADPTLADAILDRLVHRAYKFKLKGESMRKRTSPLTETGHPSS